MRNCNRIILARGCGHCCGVHYCGIGRTVSNQEILNSLNDEEKMLEDELAAIKEEKANLKNQQK